MEHHFDIELACEVGVEKAILLHNLVFWIQHNQANETHEHNGRFWTYNSAKAFTRLMPYLNPKSVSRWMRELERDGYILSSSELNSTAYDHTKWYALGPKMENRFVLPGQGQNGQSNAQNETFENAIAHSEPSIAQNEQSVAQNEQSKAQNEQPIPDSKPIVNPDSVNTDKKRCFSEKTSENTLERKMTAEQRTEYLKEARRSVETRRLAKKAAYDAVAKKRLERELVGVADSP